MEQANYIKAIFTAVFAFLSALLGVLAVPVILLVACNLIDYATGLMASKYRAQDINSYKSIRGIFKKVSMWLLVVVGAIIDEMLLYASTSIGWKSPVTFLVACVVAMWLICNEIISILENPLLAQAHILSITTAAETISYIHQKFVPILYRLILQLL